jgi:hypothetical protein
VRDIQETQVDSEIDYKEDKDTLDPIIEVYLFDEDEVDYEECDREPIE